MQQPTLKVIESEEGLPPTLVFSNERNILRTREHKVRVYFNNSSIIVRSHTAESSIELKFSTNEFAKRAFDALQLPVSEMEAAWPVDVEKPVQIAGSSTGTMADPTMDALTAQLGGTTLADVFVPASGVPKLECVTGLEKSTEDSVAITTLVAEWAENPNTKEHRYRPAGQSVVTRTAFHEPSTGDLEHDKILSAIEIMIQMFVAPDCEAGVNLEFEFRVNSAGLRGKHKGKALTGRIDCVLVDKKTGRFVVIEVKTKENEKHARVVWMEAVIQARLYAFALKKQLELDYVPDAYILSTVMYGDTLLKTPAYPKGSVVPGGLYPVGLWKVSNTEDLKSAHGAFP